MKVLKSKSVRASKFKETIENNRKIALEREKNENIYEPNIKVCQIMDNLPNKNLINIEEKYNKNNFLEFLNENNEKEYNIILTCIFKHNNLIIFIILYLRLFWYDFYTITKLIDVFCIKFYFRLISLIISYICLKINKIRIDNLLLRKIVKIIYDINHAISIYYFYSVPETSYFKIIINEFLFNGLIIFLLDLPFFYTLISYTILLIPISLCHPKNFYWFIFNSFYGIFFSLNIVYTLSKGTRNYWILFDSFKQSYIYCQQIMENNQNPIFILSKNFDILYSNKAAKHLDIYIQKNNDECSPCSPTSRRRKIGFKLEMQFQNIIIPSLWNLFMKLLKDVTESQTINQFYFPFASTDTDLGNLSFKEYANCFLVDGDFIKLHWYNVICNKCIWKYYECFYVNLIPYNSFLKNEIFNKNIENIAFKFENFIDNCNKMCEIVLRCERNIIYASSHRSKGMRKLGIYMKNNGKNKDSILSNNNDINFLFPNMDFSILFFLKNQSEILNDILITQSIYFSFLFHNQNHGIHINKVNLIDITNYWCYYFDSLLTAKNCTLNFLIRESCNILIIEEEYLRICLFNILLFIISNLVDNGNQKSIICSISLEKEVNLHHHIISFNNSSSDNFLEKKSLSETQRSIELKNSNSKDINFFLQFDFSLTGEVSYNYNHINHILQCENLDCECLKTDIYKQKFLDIGILTVYNIITKYYETKFNMCSSDEGHTIFFNMKCSHQYKIKKNTSLEISSNHNDINLYDYSNDFFYYYNIDYHEILMKNIYNLVPTTPYISNVKSKKSSKEKNLYKSYLQLINDDDSGNGSDKKDSSYNGSILGYKDLLTLNNKSVNKVKSELKSLDKDISKKQSLFHSMNLHNKNI